MTGRLISAATTALLGLGLLIFARRAYHSPTFDATLYVAAAFLFLSVGLGGIGISMQKAAQSALTVRCVGVLLLVVNIALMARGLRFPIPAWFLLIDAAVFAIIFWPEIPDTVPDDPVPPKGNRSQPGSISAR